MAHSLRSKSKLQAKSVKRKSEFARYADERSKRLAQKLDEHNKEQDAAKAARGSDAEEKSVMDLDNAGAEPKKVSTAGWRDSRHQIYKKLRHSKTKKTKKGKTMKF